MRTPAELPRRMPRTSRRFRIGILVAIVVLIVLLTSARDAARFYTSYLWFHEVHFSSVFRGVLLTRVLLGLTFCVIFFVLMMASLTIADRKAPDLLPADVNDELVERYRDSVLPHSRIVRIIVSVLFALLAGVGTNKEWNNWDLLRYHVNFTGPGSTDPEFHKNIGFYVFEMPFLKFLPGWAFEAIIVVLLVTIVAQYLNGGIRFQGQGSRVTPAVKAQLSVLLGVLALIQGVNYYFARLSLVLSKAHVVDGATATDIHANKPADELLIAIAVMAAILFLINIKVKGWTLPVVGVVVWILVWILIGHIYPALYQSLRVNPSEESREAPYIDRNISATRSAYGLTNVKTVEDFDGAATTVSASDIAGSSAQATTNQETLSNVQLLDPTQVVSTFNNLQKLRSFYSINSLSVDRYDLDVNGKSTLTETLTGVRELNNNVPSGFTTSKLQYTHGYGAAVAPATQSGVNDAGEPIFSLSDVPPQGTPSLLTKSGNDEGAQVYYGEGSDSSGFVIAKSKQEELDYEDSSGNEIQGHYAGDGGVPAGNLFRRAAFALAFGNADILLSGQVTSSSRIIYNRNISARVQKAAPFLKYDSDPYSVVLNNKLFWVVDAYTTSANYPYSQDADTSRVSSSSGLSGTFNYVRNSVKVVVNAYTGKMYFFVVDQSDPIIQVYEKAFPDLFTPVSKADAEIPGITSHWRYPQDLYEIQTNMYGRYHLTNVNQFYSQENAWDIAQDPGSGRLDSSHSITTYNANGTATTTPQLLDPSYEVAALPGQNKQQFLIVQPFVPFSTTSTANKNLSAVMFASPDPSGQPSSGQLTVYETPPGEQVAGPQLVQSDIQSNPNISEKLTLLNEQGSEVLLGAVVTVPISASTSDMSDNTLLYVQPVYVQSTSNPVPELKDVIVVYDNTAYQSDNASLDEALCQISNPTGPNPFGQYCNTSAAHRTKTSTTTSSPTKSSSSSTTSTTTTVPTTTPPTSTATTIPGAPSGTAPANATTSQLLAAAQTAYTKAEAALKAGDLGLYQDWLKQEQADLKAASDKLKG
jgi:uncharacterized protein